MPRGPWTPASRSSVKGFRADLTKLIEYWRGGLSPKEREWIETFLTEPPPMHVAWELPPSRSEVATR